MIVHIAAECAEKIERKGNGENMTAFFLAPVYIVVNIYIFIRITGWLKTGFPTLGTRKGTALSIAVYSFFALSFLIAFLMPAGAPQRIMKLLGNYWLGVLLYMIFVIVVADILRLVLLHILHIEREKLCNPKMRRIAGRICAGLILTVSVCGVINAGIVRTTPYEITVNKEAGEFESIKVVLVADLHLGYNIGVRQMEKMAEKINERDADLVVIAGDIFDNEWAAVEDPEKLTEIFRGIKSKYGVYACYGNHDIEEPILAGFTFGSDDNKSSHAKMDAFLDRSGIRLLRDEGVLVEDSFYLYGRPDALRSGGERLNASQITETMDKGKPIIVIDHQPRELKELAKAGVDVDLCGHTHDGQIFPGNLLMRVLWKNSYGYMKVGNMQNIVTSGVGLFGPNMRVATKAEICPITINFKA